MVISCLICLKSLSVKSIVLSFHYNLAHSTEDTSYQEENLWLSRDTVRANHYTKLSSVDHQFTSLPLSYNKAARECEECNRLSYLLLLPVACHTPINIGQT